MARKLDVLKAVQDTNRPRFRPQSLALMAAQLSVPKHRVSILLQRLKNQDMVFLADGKRWHLTDHGRKVFDE